MTIPTCAVACSVHDDAGDPVAGAKITARLDRFEVYNGYVVPTLIEAETDASGAATLDLWPNQLGSTESSYTIRIVAPNGKTLKTTATVPNVSNASLHLIANLPAYEGKTDGQLVIDAAVAAVAPAVAAKDLAVIKAAEASASATAASNSATSASTSATTATTQASNATTSATAAANSASAASGSAASASGSASTATTKAGEALASAQSATDSATAASASATTASTQAGTATTKASEAAASASTATAQATIATNKAGEASASAATAAGHAATANTARTDAQTAATQAASNATAAGTSATSAAVQAGNAAASATTAQGAASTATTQASNAATSAATATTQASNAATSANAAANSATASATSASVSAANADLSAGWMALATAQASNAAASASAANSSAGAASGSAALALSVYGTAAAQQSALTAAQSAASVAQAAAASAGAVLQQDLSAVNVAALHRSPSATTAMFVYDTSKDSDGGAWTEKCQGTSWYNEELAGAWLPGGFASEADARDYFASLGQTSLLTGDNNNFSGGPGGWSAGSANGTVSVVAGRLRVTQVAAAGSQSLASIAVTTVIGQRYQIAASLVTPAPSNNNSFLNAATGPNSGVYLSVNMGATPGTKYASFVATSTTTYIMFAGSTAWTPGQFAELDDITVRPVSYAVSPSGAYFQLSTDGKFYRLWKNLISHSEDFSNAAWTRRGTCAVTANAIAAPDGAMTADLISGLGTSGNDIYTQTATTALGVATSPSFYINRVSTSGVLRVSNPLDSSRGNWHIDLSLVGSGWQRIALGHPAVTVVTSFTGGGASDGLIFLAQSGGPLSVHLWGAQLELGSTATAYESKGAIGSTSEVFRGNKADFPRLAGVVAEANHLVIYDLTEAGRPMWMRFLKGADSNTSTFAWRGFNNNQPTGFAAASGRLLMGTSGGGWFSFNFPADSVFNSYPNPNQGVWRSNIALRNQAGGYLAPAAGIPTNSGNTANAIACMVLPDAPLDPVTGLAVPTIAVGTGEGPSVIRHDGVVTNPYPSNLSSPNISFGSRGEVIFHIGENGKNYRVSLPPYTSHYSYIDSPITPVQAIFPISSSVNRVNAKRQAAIRSSATNGLFLFRDNTNGPRSSAALVTNTFNTGHMHGDIRRAYLADIEAGSVGAELITNGGFDSAANWTNSSIGAGTFSIAGGKATVVGTTGTDRGAFTQTNSFVVGRLYQVTLDVTRISGTIGIMGSSVGSGGFSISSSGTHRVYWAAQASNFIIYTFSGGGNFEIDNISVREAVADRSYKAAAAPLAGTLTKSPVASAAQLVAYSGFDNLDYVREPYSTDLDFGTGDWSVGAWLNTTGFGPHNLLANPERFEDSSWSKSNSFVQTNLLTWSEDFTNAAWVKNNPGVAVLPVVTANAGVAPDGTLTADRVQLDCGNTGSAVNRSNLTQTISGIVSGSAYTPSIYIKAFDANSVGKTVRLASDFISSAVYTLTSDWVRVPWGAVSSGTPTNLIIETRGTFTTQTADVLIWGAQLVQGSTAGDYTQTTSAAAPTRYTNWDGTLTGRKLVETTATAQHQILQSQTLTAAAYTLTVYAKADQGPQRWLSVYPQGTGVTAAAVFDINAGTVTFTTGAQLIGSSIVSVGGGWYRCSVSFTGAAVSVANVLYLSNASNAASPGYTGDGTSGIYIYGAQLNRGSVATVYKPGQILAYDNAGWLVDRGAEYLGAELNGDAGLTNTGFWTANAGVTVGGGKVAFSSTTVGNAVSRNSLLTAGRRYRVTFTIANYVAGAVGIETPSPQSLVFSGNGTFTVDVVANGATVIYFTARNATTTLDITSISIREYWNPHIRLGLDSQGRLITSVSDGITTRTVTSTGTYNSGTWVKAEAAYRAGRLALLANGQEIGFTHGTPLLSLTSRYNLLAWSEQFDNAVWTRYATAVTANSTTAPNATTTADTITCTQVNDSHTVGCTITLVTGVNHCASVYAKAGTHNFIQFGFSSQGGTIANFDLSAGVVGTSSGVVSTSMVNEGNGWYRCQIVYVPSVAATGFTVAIVPSASATRYQALNATGNETVFLWGAQLELGSVATPYQRTTTVPETNVADLTIGSGTDVYAAFPGSISQVKLSGTVPSPDQSTWIYEQEKQLFRAGAQCCLPDSASIVDLAYDEVTDRWVAVSPANESNWNGLVRTSVTAVPAGAYTRVSYGGGVELMGRSTTNPGVDVSIPPYGLREELVKRAEAAARLTRTLSTFDYVGGFTANTTSGSSGLASVANLTYPLTTTIVGAVVTGSGIPAGASVAGISGTNIHLSAAATATATGVQVNFTDFVLPAGYEAEIVMVAGAVKREGATQDYTRLFDGFRETIRFAVAPGNTAWVQIQAMRVNA